ncbi:MAG TPA: hypothetical protein VEI97_04105, partial [bacterium]|nr:hypothetical protein [bacterium]
PLYRRYGFLFSKDLAQALQTRLEAGQGQTDGNLRHLYGYIAQGWIEEQQKATEETKAAAEAACTVTVDGRTLPYRALPIAIAAEPDRGRRHALKDAKVAADRDLLPFHRELWEAAHGLARELGYMTYLDYCHAIHGVDYPALNRQLQQFLATTADHFRGVFGPWMQGALGIPLEAGHAADISHLLRQPRLDSLLPKEQLLPTLDRFTTGMGLPIAEIPAIRLDLESRPGKSPRAFCSPIAVGQEVMVTLSPHGGLPDYTTLLHELGHAYHFAFCDPSLPVEERTLGDRAVSEGFAFLFNYLPENPAFLERCVGIGDPTPVIQGVLRTKLWMLRRYGAKLNYEVALHQGPSLELAEPLYVRNLEDALLVRHEPTNALIDLDSDLYCADYLRAWIWEVQLRRHLEAQFGAEWFADPRAGRALVELWRLGERHAADELARMVGYDSLDIGPLTDVMLG